MDTDDLVWYGNQGDSEYTAEHGAVTVAMVVYCAEGKADGSLVAFARLLAAARGVDVSDVKPSPAGWYWSGTVRERGLWTTPAGPFDTSEQAIHACIAAPWAFRE